LYQKIYQAGVLIMVYLTTLSVAQTE